MRMLTDLAGLSISNTNGCDDDSFSSRCQIIKGNRRISDGTLVNLYSVKFGTENSKVARSFPILIEEHKSSLGEKNILDREEVKRICSEIRLQTRYTVSQSRSVTFGDNERAVIDNFETDPYSLDKAFRISMSLYLLMLIDSDQVTFAKLSSLADIIRGHTLALAGFSDKYVEEFANAYETLKKGGKLSLKSK